MPKPFKFFNVWAEHQGFIPLVQKVWWCKYVKGSPMFRVCCKLRVLKPELKALNKKHFGDVFVRASVTKEELDSVQLKLDKQPFDLNLQGKERELCFHFASLCRAEESFATQKSRIQWLSLGDSNRFFFFSLLIIIGIGVSYLV